jgi:hypothetical protein
MDEILLGLAVSLGDVLKYNFPSLLTVPRSKHTWIGCLSDRGIGK